MKLLKYEIRKNIVLKLVLLGLFAVVEVFFIYGCIVRNQNAAIIGATLLTVGSLAGIITIGIQSMITLHHDMNTKQAYMLFMTPKSCYSILGAKLAEALLSMLIVVAVVAGACVFDIRLLLRRFLDVAGMAQMARELLDMFHVQMNLASISVFVIDILFSWIFMFTTAYFADVLVSSLLRGKRFGGILAFILFVVLNTLLNSIIGKIMIGNTEIIQTIVRSCICLAASAVMYIVSARIMETKLSV